MQIHNNSSNLVVSILAKRVTALLQQVSVSTEHRECRRAIELQILLWDNFRSLLGDGLMKEVKCPSPWTRAQRTDKADKK